MAPEGRSTVVAWWVLLLALVILAVVFLAVLRLENRQVPPGLVLAGAGLFVVAAIALIRKTRTRWPAALVGALVVAAVATLWVVPAIAGADVECIDTERDECEARWRELADYGRVDLLFLPVTSAVVSEGGCSVRVESAFGLFYIAAIC